MKLNTTEFEVILRETLEYNKQQSDSKLHSNIFVTGGPGIGKTYTIEKVAKDLNLQFFDIRLAAISPLDIQGLPYVNKEKNRSDFTLPRFFPEPDHSGFDGTILFFDEMNAATGITQAAAMQVFGEKRIAGHDFPPKTYVIGAGNRGSRDRANTFELSGPLQNRLLHLELTDAPEEIYKSFVNYVASSGIELHPTITGILAFKNELIYKPSPMDAAFPTPRSWTRLSHRMTYEEGLGKETKDSIIEGEIGLGAATELKQFANLYSKLPKFPEAVLEGYFPDKENKLFQYIYCAAILSQAKGNPELVAPVLRIYSNPVVPREIIYACLRSSPMTFYGLLMDKSNTEFLEFRKEIYKF